jgi:hypothetical protein
MKKKLLLTLFLVLFVLAGAKFIIAQTPTATENFSDRQYDQTWSCVHMEQNGQIQFGENSRKIPKSPIKMSGVCNDPVSCEVVICALPTGPRREEGEGRDRDPCLSIGMGGVGLNGERPQEDIPSYCYDKCWVNKDENISPELKQFFASAVSAQAGPGSNINTNNVLLYMPYITFDGKPDLNSFTAGSFTDIPGVLHNAHGHAVYMVYAAPTNGIAPTITLLSPLPTAKSTNNNTQQLGTLTTSSTAIQINGGDPQMCTIVLWDPYGRVFDAQSLEPLGENEAIVTLLDKDGNRVGLPTNDDSLDVFGLYNILVVKDDNYKLKVVPKTKHLFEPVIVNPLYKDLFSEFIYRAGDPPFYEKADDPKRVDIPLKPIGTPYSRPIEIGRMVQKDLSNGTQFIIKVTHPLSIVKVISNGKVLTEDGYGKKIPGQTDKSGLWQVVIKKSLLSQYGYSIEVSKNPKYYQSGTYTRTVSPDPNHIVIDDKTITSGDSSTVTGYFNPLLEYIEGYAYGNNQKIISNAKVNVILKTDKSIYYQTTTDSSGFFTIYSKNLPFLDYYLEFIDPQTQIKITQSTSQFVKNNEDYISSEGLDFMNSTKNNQPIINPTTGELNNSFGKVDSAKNNLTGSNLKNTNTLNIRILTIIFVVFILIIGTLGIIIYIRKSNS